MNIKKELGEQIKRIRKKRNLTQEQLAEMIDITPRNLSGIEVGANFVKAETLEKLLAALNVTTEELFATNHLKESSELADEIINHVQNIKNNRAKLERVYKIVKLLSEE